MGFLHSRRTKTGAVVLLAAVAATPAVATAAGSRPDTTALAGQVASARETGRGGPARNVILLIGDGMGDSEITIARNYQVGAAGRLALDRLPKTGDYTTYSVQQDNPSLPDYVPDSAATGTAWATGHKTYDGAISVLPNGKAVSTILERAQRAGYRTGDVTTAELQDATPAVLASHVVNRDCKGPQSMDPCPSDAKENGGKGSIAEQMVATRPDVMLGGGKTYFDQTVQGGKHAGETVLQQAAESGYQIVTDRQGLGRASGRKPLLGVFADGNLEVQWTGPVASPTGTPPTRCTANPAWPAAQPRLVDMTRKAIDILDDQTKRSPRGFFLQVEGASIDKQETEANPCGQVGETVGFDAAVRQALHYQEHHPRTLVVVTADHGQASQIIEAGSTSPGPTATLRTADGADMTINYGTAPAGSSQQHTGTQVRIAARGPRASDVLGLTDQTDLFHTMRRALGLG